MRRALFFVVVGFASVAFGQHAERPVPENPFALPGGGAQAWENQSLDGAPARYAETLALIEERLKVAPADIVALERACTLLERMNRALELTRHVRDALEVKELEPEVRAKVRGLLGHLLVLQANGMGGNFRIIILGGGGGRQRWQPQRNEEARKLYKEAEPHLRAALQRDGKDRRAISDLIDCLEGIDDEANAAETGRLRMERAALTPTTTTLGLGAIVLDAAADDLRDQAYAKETLHSGPDHAGALPLRRQALVLQFCSRTIPFSYRASLYAPISLLAPESMVQHNLTRYFLKQSGDVDSVPVQYYAADEQTKLELVRDLATDSTDNATAALLAILRRARAAGEIEEAALFSLQTGERPALRVHLPALLAIALHNTDLGNYPANGQRCLVRLAGALRLSSAAPILIAALQRERDLHCPRGLLTALGAIGRPEDAEVLLKVARDPAEDVYFRRRAVDALSLMAFDQWETLGDPLLEPSVAVARYRTEPDEALRGRILAALEDEHLADDAAAYCVQLNMTEAIPALERLVGERAAHYSRSYLDAALKQLKAR